MADSAAPERYVRPLTAESAGDAPGRGRLQGRRVLVVGGGQRTFDAATDPVGNGRAMSLLFAREGAHVAVADVNLRFRRGHRQPHRGGRRPRLCHSGRRHA